MKHAPRYRYDCSRCKFEWNCGYCCHCNLKTYPDPPDNIKRDVAKALKEAKCTPPRWRKLEEE